MIDLKAIEERQKTAHEFYPSAAGSLGRLLGADIPALCQVRELRLALLKYGGHELDCDDGPYACRNDNQGRKINHKCDCGWDELKQRLENANG